MLARLGDKWSLLIVWTLGEGPLRFNALRRRVAGISQKMLSSTLKALERDGLVSRVPGIPLQVEYALTELGHEFLGPASALAKWTGENAPRIIAARADYDSRAAAEAAG
ncbi:helix-turn-helix domain-containing protein [Streptomyces sp. NPDC007084]|uniref:winged helix-turn-helix transcriptional regulator n=1 Tax=Streptomyces sp. NPDC007084 TaxID=3154313 RepID=UPI0034558AC8